jgi:hypothetical protein
MNRLKDPITKHSVCQWHHHVAVHRLQFPQMDTVLSSVAICADAFFKTWSPVHGA